MSFIDVDRLKLSDDLKYWRAERPDEWIMDRFIKKAELLETVQPQQVEGGNSPAQSSPTNKQSKPFKPCDRCIIAISYFPFCPYCGTHLWVRVPV